jgi:hypothetical protein
VTVGARAADPVVADLDAEHTVVDRRCDLGFARVRVPATLVSAPRRRNAPSPRSRAAADRRSASLATGTGMRAAGKSTPARRPPRVRAAGGCRASSRGSVIPLRVPERLGHELRRASTGILELARELERDHRVDEPLLRAVVQVADSRRRLVGRGQDASPRRRELRAPGRWRSRRDELVNLATRFEVDGQRLRAGSRRQWRPRAGRRRRSACPRRRIPSRRAALPGPVAS